MLGVLAQGGHNLACLVWLHQTHCESWTPGKELHTNLLNTLTDIEIHKYKASEYKVLGSFTHIKLLSPNSQASLYLLLQSKPVGGAGKNILV